MYFANITYLLICAIVYTTTTRVNFPGYKKLLKTEH